MKKTIACLALQGLLAGILLSLVENGLLIDYVRTGYRALFLLAVLVGGALFSLLIVPFGVFLFLAVKRFLKKPEDGVLPAVLTSVLFVVLLTGVHYRWFLAHTGFLSPAGIAFSLALILCMFPAFFLISVLVRYVVRPVRPVFRAVIIAAFLLFIYRPYLTAGWKAPPPRADLPNFLVISFDTLRADHVGCYGYKGDETETIDALAAAGMLFERAYTPMPRTNPAHNAIMTGLHPRSVGVVTNFNRREDKYPILARSLKELGYRTAAFVSGGTMKGYHSGLEKGFDVYGDAFSFLDVLDRSLVVPIAHRAPLLTVPRFERRAAPLTSEALAWLKGSYRRPFFLFVHYYDPHHDYVPPAEYVERIGLIDKGEDIEKLNREWFNDLCKFKKAGSETVEKITALYDAEIAYADSQLARLMRFLDEKRLGENTYVIFLSDHGEGLYDHDDCVHGYNLHEEQVRVPLIVAGPGVAAGARSGAPVQLIDIFPTVLSLLNEDVPPGLPGESLKDVLSGEGAPGRENIFMETVYLERGVGKGKNRPVDRAPVVGGVTERYKYMFRRRGGREAFYDLREDPRELEALDQEQAAGAGELADVVHLWDRETEVLKLKESRMSPEMAKKLRALGYIK